MLKLGEGRDASALFEAHHPFTNRKYLERLLQDHEVDPLKVRLVVVAAAVAAGHTRHGTRARSSPIGGVNPGAQAAPAINTFFI